jgi:hypothetical protein
MKKILFLFTMMLWTLTSLYSQTTFSWRNDQNPVSGQWNVPSYWWNGSGAALPGGGEILFLDGSVGTTMTNDLPSTNRYRILFGSGGSSRIVNGSTENTFYDFSATKPKIENNSSNTQTINFPIKFGYNPMELNPVSGNLTIGGAINNNGNYLDVYGPNSKELKISSTLSGTGGLTIKQNSKVIYTSVAKTYSGATVLDAGTLELQVSASSTSITVNSGATLLINGTDITINSLTINGTGVVNILPGKSLTVSGTLTNLAGNAGLIIASDETGTGSLIHTTSSISGTVQRFMNNADWASSQDGWHLISSPVTSQAISPNFTTDPYDFYCWYEPTAQWVNFKNTTTAPTWNTANGSTNFTLGRGYMAAYDAGGTKNFTGTLNVANVSFSNLTFNAGTFDGLHLLGNPFSSAITWYTGWSTTAVGGVAKIWNEAGLSYSSINAGEIIPETQGFFIEVSSGTNAITIPAANRTHSAQAFYKATTYPVIKLSANNIDFPSFQESQIRFNPASTEAYDFEFDGQFFAGYAPLFYSVSDGKNLDVNSLPTLELSTIIPFTFIKNEGDNFSINAEIENVSETVYLLDKKTSIDHDLSTNPVYTFTATANDDPNRFEIHFGVVGINESNNENSLNTYVYGDRLYVMNTSGKTNLQLFDLQGRLVQSSVLNGTGLQSQSVNLPAGVYVVRVNDEKSVKSVKLVIE